jgi:hypothetical protein
MEFRSALPKSGHSQRDRRRHRAAVDLVAEHLGRSNQSTALFRRTCLSSDLTPKSQSRLKIDEQKRVIFGTQEREIVETYFDWPVRGSTDMRVV